MVIIDGKDLSESKEPLEVVGLEVELTSGFEASIAEFKLAGAYYPSARSFDLSKAKKTFSLGSSVIIKMGYATSVREVFRGFIARVRFVIPADDTSESAFIGVTAMDVKGIMMANRHSRRLRATIYSDAVKEVMDAVPYLTQKDDQGQPFVDVTIDATPDKESGGSGGEGGGGGKVGGKDDKSDTRVEMVEESDYEFIVKVAKKFNFEFYSVGKNVYFTQAKKNETPLMELSPNNLINRLEVEYDITGLARSVEVRSVNMDDGKFLGKSKKSNAKISLGSKAKPLVDKQKLVYLDSSVDTKETAGYRAEYLMALNEYRLGSLSATCIGLPELVPGRFIEVINAGEPLSNLFYLTRVRHVMDDGNFYTEIEGSANSIAKQ